MSGKTNYKYHDMMYQIFEEMKSIRDSGGITLTLDLEKRVNMKL